MMGLRTTTARAIALIAVTTTAGGAARAAEPLGSERAAALVKGVALPLMQANDIPGMAVAITRDGETRIFNFGLASTADKRPVDDRTIFEIGSLSKTFTGLLGALAMEEGKLKLTDEAAAHLPALAGRPIGSVKLLDLATYTAGGLPLQFPETVKGEKGVIAYFREWQPKAPAGSRRLYSNPSIGLFGDLAARAEGQDFERIMMDEVLPKLGLKSTFIHVPKAELNRYAYGTSKDGRPVRVTPGPLDEPAYGIKTTAADLIRYVQLEMDPSGLEAPLRRAVEATQTGYYRFGQTLQGLGWEIYDAPYDLKGLMDGNGPSVALEPQGATKLDPPQAPQPDRFVNKTGSTGGFGAYAAFLPGTKTGIVLLANRSYPNPQRVEAAWKIIEALK